MVKLSDSMHQKIKTDSIWALPHTFLYSTVCFLAFNNSSYCIPSINIWTLIKYFLTCIPVIQVIIRLKNQNQVIRETTKTYVWAKQLQYIDKGLWTPDHGSSPKCSTHVCRTQHYRTAPFTETQRHKPLPARAKSKLDEDFTVAKRTQITQPKSSVIPSRCGA